VTPCGWRVRRQRRSREKKHRQWTARQHPAHFL